MKTGEIVDSCGLTKGGYIQQFFALASVSAKDKGQSKTLLDAKR